MTSQDPFQPKSFFISWATTVQSAAYNSQPFPYRQLEEAMEADTESQGVCTQAPTARSWLPRLPSAFEGTLLCPLVTNLWKPQAVLRLGRSRWDMTQVHEAERPLDMRTAHFFLSPPLCSTPPVLLTVDDHCTSLPTELFHSINTQISYISHPKTVLNINLWQLKKMDATCLNTFKQSTWKTWNNPALAVDIIIFFTKACNYTYNFWKHNALHFPVWKLKSKSVYLHAVLELLGRNW